MRLIRLIMSAQSKVELVKVIRIFFLPDLRPSSAACNNSAATGVIKYNNDRSKSMQRTMPIPKHGHNPWKFPSSILPPELPLPPLCRSSKNILQHRAVVVAVAVAGLEDVGSLLLVVVVVVVVLSLVVCNAVAGMGSDRFT